MKDSSQFAELFGAVREAIARHAMLRAGDSVGAAVSGGADSVALALILMRLRSEIGVTIFLAHFNHQLRGADSEADENFVREFAAQHGLELICGREDVAARARENGWNLEEAARRLRYAFFAEIARAGRAARIAVAHTASDQAETVLAQIIRGTGPTGLAGIYPVAQHVIRPLLGVRGETLREFLRAEKQAWREDLSNQDESRLRARIRHRLLPLLETDFQPRVVEQLGRLANLAREDEAFWQVLVEDRFQSLVARGENCLKISTNSLLNPIAFAPAGKSGDSIRAIGADSSRAALTKRLLRRIFEEIAGTRAGLTSAHVDDVISMAMNSLSGSRIHLPGGITVDKSFGDLIFAQREAAATRREFAYELPILGADSATIEIPEIRHRLSLKVIDWPAATRETRVLAIDWESLRAPLVVRNWQPGDAFRPHGRLHEHKLKELLRVKRVPVRERAAWPVLTSAGSVVWSRGFPVAEAFAAGAKTRRGVMVVEEPI